MRATPGFVASMENRTPKGVRWLRALLVLGFTQLDLTNLDRWAHREGSCADKTNVTLPLNIGAAARPGGGGSGLFRKSFQMRRYGKMANPGIRFGGNEYALV